MFRREGIEKEKEGKKEKKKKEREKEMKEERNEKRIVVKRRERKKKKKNFQLKYTKFLSLLLLINLLNYFLSFMISSRLIKLGNEQQLSFPCWEMKSKQERPCQTIFHFSFQNNTTVIIIHK